MYRHFRISDQISACVLISCIRATSRAPPLPTPFHFTVWLCLLKTTITIVYIMQLSSLPFTASLLATDILLCVTFWKVIASDQEAHPHNILKWRSLVECVLSLIVSYIVCMCVTAGCVLVVSMLFALRLLLFVMFWLLVLFYFVTFVVIWQVNTILEVATRWKAAIITEHILRMASC